MKKVFGLGCATLLSINLNFKMKFSVFILILSLFQLQANTSFSQKNEVSVEFKNVNLEKVLNRIENLTEYKFIYKDKEIDYKKSVSITAKKEKLSSVLIRLFSNSNITYEIVGKQIILKIKDNKSIKVIKQTNTKKASQNININGVVKDVNGITLPGASVLEKGTNNGTSTDFEGNFSLKVKDLKSILIVSFLGYTKKELALNGKNSIDITLEEDTANLEEIVVVGYGSQKKVTITGAVSDIKTKEIQQTQTANLANNLTGRVPGLVINSRGGEPGSDAVSILIRGISTTGDNTPLYVIDGIPNRGSFERLNPADIESISVLKDASAAIYGAQAANGVILITTKRGKSGETIFSYNQSYSISQPTRRPELMNAQQYLTWVDEKNERNGRPREFQNLIRAYRNGTVDTSVWGDTDWWSTVIEDWTPQIQHSISARGGSEKTQFFVSGQFLDQDALYLGSAYGYKQYNIRSNIDTRFSDTFKMSFDLAARVGDKSGPTLDTDGLIRQVFVQAPYEFPYFENGLVAKTSSGNPISLVNGNSGNRATNTKKFDSRFAFKWDLPFITKGLYTEGYAALDFYTTSRKDLSKPFDQYEFNEITGEYDNLKFQTGSINLFQQTSEELNQTYHLKLGYNREFNKHKINSFIAFEQYKQEGEFLFASRQDLVSEDIPFLFSGSDENKENGGGGYQAARRNYFGKFNYSYDDKYLLDLTFRYDGSANFAKDKRFGFFPAALLGWRISQEDFFNTDLVKELKVRASWGILGNDRVANFQYFQLYNLVENSYIFGENRVREIGLTPSTVPNPNITWETSEKYNFGVDFRLKNNILTGSLDLFYENRSDILAPRNASIPVYSGLELPDENIGRVTNQGMELKLNHRGKIKNINYTLGGQFTYARSEIKFIDEAANVPDWQRRTGKPVDFLLVYQANGIYNNQEDIDNSVHFPDAKPGDVIFVDQNDDGVLNQEDQIILENSPTPRIVYGFNVGLEWNNLSLNVLLQGQAGAQTIYRPFDLNQQSYFYENRWRSERLTPNATYPAAYDLGSSSFQEVSTVWVKDNSFLRVKNVELSYALKDNLLQSIGLDSFRIFLTGHNLFLIYDNVGINDPESTSSTGWFYPQQRLLSTGISLTF
jgi:TonB-linked SusC/RagA family outer membrane protein